MQVYRLAIISLFVCFTGCFRQPIPELFDATEFESINSGRQAQVLEMLTARAKMLRSYRALLSGVYEAKGEKLTGKQSLVFLAPNNIRLEFFAPPLDQLATIVTIKDGKLKAFNVPENSALIGEGSKENIEGLIGLPLEVSEIALWLFGAFPFPMAKDNNVLLNKLTDEYLVQVGTSDRRVVTMVVDELGDHFVPRALRITTLSTGTVLFQSEYHYSEEAELKKVPVPSKITFWVPEFEASGTLAYDHYEVNPSLERMAHRLFDVTFPFGTKVERLD